MIIRIGYRDRVSESSVEDEDEERVSLFSFCEGKLFFFSIFIISELFNFIYSSKVAFAIRIFVKINFHKVLLNIPYITERLKLDYI